jgi:hypothetical protein
MESILLAGSTLLQRALPGCMVGSDRTFFKPVQAWHELTGHNADVNNIYCTGSI